MTGYFDPNSSTNVSLRQWVYVYPIAMFLSNPCSDVYTSSKNSIFNAFAFVSYGVMVFVC